MAKHKADINIGYRAAEELLRLGIAPTEARNRFGLRRTTTAYWRDGMVPSATNLQRLHYAGADVVYILTGRRRNE